MKILTFDPKKDKYVLAGTLEDRVFMRKVKPEHFMEKVQGYGIQENAFQDIVKRGVTRIILQEEATGDAWIADLKHWLDNSRIADYGSGKQRFLSTRYMTHIACPHIHSQQLGEVKYCIDCKKEIS